LYPLADALAIGDTVQTAVLTIIGILLLGGLIVFGRRLFLLRRRVLWENALKQIYTAKHEGRPTTPLEIAGRLCLSPSAMLRLAQALEAAGLVQSHSGFLNLTPTGEQLGLRILRGHRLWEHYLSGDVRVPLEQLHRAAERAEHRFSADEISALADHLGHPRTDPHGDVIPTAGGEFLPQQRTPLTDWLADRLAVVVHIEDEPREALRDALRAGLQPGTVLRVIGRDANAITCETPIGRCIVSPAVAANIDVRPATDSEQLEKPWASLSDLPLGERAEVIALSDRCTGLSRRRLLDLGFTAGAPVRAVLANVHDAAHAYEIRGSVIALRKEQAMQVLVRPVVAQSAAPADPGRG
jgi:DtxR family Mn-dependent transcriptional regulator